MSVKEAVFTAGAPAPPPFLSQATKSNGMVYCSGSLGNDPVTGKMVEGPIQGRARQIFKNLSAILEAANSSLDNVVKVNIYLTTMSNFASVNEVYVEFFNKDPRPSRTCVAVFELPGGADIEVECIAAQNAPASNL